jgi:hypothetical protein
MARVARNAESAFAEHFAQQTKRECLDRRGCARSICGTSASGADAAVRIASGEGLRTGPLLRLSWAGPG